ncbi:hypothetical protein FB480_101874 [Agrobacterium vitis]|nr:hypothetical protein FB480_101874 [Agrobacterium vitis]
MLHPRNWFGARYWLFMTPFMAGSFSNSFKVSWFGLWPAIAIVLVVTMGSVALFRFILDRYWTRKP